MMDDSKDSSNDSEVLPSFTTQHVSNEVETEHRFETNNDYSLISAVSFYFQV